MKKSIALNHLNINTFIIKFFTQTTCCATGHSLHVALQPSLGGTAYMLCYSHLQGYISGHSLHVLQPFSGVYNRAQPIYCATATSRSV